MNILSFLIDIQSRDRGVVGRVAQVQTRLDRAAASANRLRNAFAGVREAAMTLPGAQFFTNPIVAMTAGIGAVSKLGMDAGKTAVSFEVLCGSMEKGSKLLGEINKYADDTIYDRMGTQEAAKTMLGFGVAQERINDDLRMLGDIAMGDKNRLSGLALVYGQVASAGKLQGQDLLQLINQGYNPLIDLSKKTGKSVSALRDEMSKGNISFEMMREAMQMATGTGGKFNGMVERIAQTPFGRFQQLVGEFTKKLLELYNLIDPMLIPAFNAVSAVLSSTAPAIRTAGVFLQWVGKNIEWISAVLVPVAAGWVAYTGYVAFSTAILKGWTVAEWLQVSAMMVAEKVQWMLNRAMMMNPIGLVIAAVLALVAAVVYCWNKFAGFRAFLITAWDTVKKFGSIIKEALIDRFWSVVEGIGAVGKAVKALIKGDFDEAWNYAKQAGVKLSGIETARKTAQKVKEVTNAIPERYAETLEKEQKKQAKGIETPKAVGGMASTAPGMTNNTTGEEKGKANEITTGGTRNTEITIHLGKFFDNINVNMMEKTDTAQLQRVILECINRTLETGLSAAR